MLRLIRLPLLLGLALALTGCGETAPDSPSASDATPTEIVSYTRSGGLMGRTEMLRLYSDGTIAIGDPGASNTQRIGVPAAQMNSLSAAFSSIDWQNLESEYGRQLPDGYSYTITATGKTVTTYDGATHPPILDTIIDQLNRLLEMAPSS